jgi:hypothetical protein
MKSPPFYSLVVLGAFAVLPARVFSAESGCQDFLSLWNKKPSYIQFVKCSQRHDLQDEPFEATYRVGGQYAARAEEYLVHMFKIARLKRTCCVWESVDNSYLDAARRMFSISFATKETSIDKRSEWPRIDDFYITVELIREEP